MWLATCEETKLGVELCSDKNLVLNLDQDKDPSINKNLVCEKKWHFTTTEKNSLTSKWHQNSYLESKRGKQTLACLQ